MTTAPSLHALKNGMRVVLVPCEAESVAVGLFVASGSRHETAKTAGISHFIEHMLFKGTPTRRPIDITRAIEGRGGNFNACTSEESTCFYTHLPREYLGESIDILSDMYLRATMPAEEFRRERAVVLEEIKMYADEPDSVAQENLQRALFPKSRLGAPVAGNAASLMALEPEDLRRYVKAHYRADNTVAVVVGDFETSAALSLLEAAFRSLPRSRARKAVDETKLFVAATPKVSAEKDILQTQLALGYRTFGVTDRRNYSATVMDAILGRGMSSRLFQAVREKRGLSYDISSRMQFFSDAGMFGISAGLDGRQLDKALKTIDVELRRIREKAVGAAELKRTKEFLVGNFRLSHERMTSKMFFYGMTMMAFGRLVLPNEQVAGIAAVTAEDVKRTANAILRPENRAVSTVVPRAARK